MPAVLTNGYGYLGAILEDYTWSRDPHSPRIRGEGVVVRDVLPGSPASDSGLAISDVIVEFNGISVRHDTANQLSERIASLRPDQEVTLTVRRPVEIMTYPSDAILPVPPYLTTSQLQIRVCLGMTPATRPAVNGQPLATRLAAIGQSSLPSRHFLIISGESILRPGVGSAAIIYVIDEEHDLLSLMVYDTRRIESFKDAIALDRVFKAPFLKGADENIRVAGAVIGNKYTAFTSRLPQGGEGLYVLDRHGTIALFTFDSATRKLAPLDVTSVKEAFK
ncbi:MAG TPA: PDZ domain-containing protein [Humisphaera sp.]|nr:PDZ domain-containing protein [Humisphaera sp.]